MPKKEKGLGTVPAVPKPSKNARLSKASAKQNKVSGGSAQVGRCREAIKDALRQRTHSALVRALASSRDSNVELADVISEHYLGHGAPAVFDEHNLYRFDTDTGLYLPVPLNEISVLVYDINKSPVAGKDNFKASPARAQSMAKIIGHRHAKPGYFHQAPYGLSVANGFFAVRNKRIVFEPHSRHQRQRVRIEIDYDAQAECPKTEAFLLEVFGSAEVVVLLFEVIGVALLGLGAKYQRAFILFGPGSNGKGVIELITELTMPVGSVSAVAPTEMCQDYQRYPLKDSRLNLVGEFTDFGKGGWAALKSAIAGDPISVRRVRETGFQVRPRALNLFATNILPPPPESGYAVERRFRVLVTSSIVRERDADRDLAQNLFNAEKQGILRRAIDAARHVVRRGYYSDPDCVRLPTLAWINKRNSVALFIRECLIQTMDPEDRISASDMYEACVRFCKSTNMPAPSSQKALASELDNFGFVNTKSSNMFWIGVRFRR